LTRDELRNAIANACDIMHREALTTMDYVEQSSGSCSPRASRLRRPGGECVQADQNN
jgi:hypothetical protein